MSDFKITPELPEVNLIPVDLVVSQQSTGLAIDGTPKNNVVNTANNPVTPDSNVVPAGGGSIVKGFLKSPNYSTHTTGWAINANGDAEFNGTIIAGGYTQVFRQASIPTSLHINDVWIDTDDSNKLYVAASVGADAIAAGEWVLTSPSTAWSVVLDDDGNKPDNNADVTSTKMSDGTVEVISQIFTAGEDLTANKFVCFKLGSNTTTKYDNSDAEVREGDPTNNFGSEDPMTIGYLDNNPTGDKKREAYLKFESLPFNVSSATLYLYVTQRYGAGSLEVSLYSLNADFTDSTITWNSKPTSTLIGGSEKSITSGMVGKWISWDISSYILSVQRAGGTFYGLAIRVKSGEANNWFRTYPVEAGSMPYISFVLNGTDGKVYLADRDAYTTSRFVVGKTLEAVDAEDPVMVQVAGIMSDIDWSPSFPSGAVGYPAMLTDSGSAGMTSLPRLIDYTKRNIELGMILSTSKILFNPKHLEDLLISTETLSAKSDYWAQTSDGSGIYHYDATVYPPILARKAIIDYNANGKSGATSGELILVKDSLNNVTNSDMNYDGINVSVTFKGNWANIINSISFTAANCSSSYPSATIYYFG